MAPGQQRAIVSLFLMLSAFLLQADTAPVFRSVKAFPKASLVYSTLAADQQQNLYVGGYFNEEFLTFGNQTLSNSSGDHIEGFIAKLDKNQNPIWTKQTVGRNNEFITGVVTDGSNNSYLQLQYHSVTGIPTSFNGTSLLSASNLAFAVFALDSSGQTLWHRRYAGVHVWYRGKGIAVDAGGSVRVVGWFENDDLFVCRINASGTTNLWSVRHGKVFAQPGHGPYITLDSSGNAYVAANFEHPTVSFDSVTITNRGYSNAYIAKYDPAGVLLSVTPVGGSWRTYFHNITCDEAGNVYIAGAGGHTENTFFWGDQLVGDAPSGIFVAKISSAGQLLWIRGIQGVSSDRNFTDSIALCVSPSGEVIVSFNLFDGSYSAGLVAFDANGQRLWEKIPKTKSNGVATTSFDSVVVNQTGKILVSGSMETEQLPGRSEFDSIAFQPTPNSLTIMTLLATPRLSTFLDGNSLTLSWPTNEAGFQLQETVGLNSNSWLPVSGVSISSSNYTVSKPLSATNRFYRLHK